MCLRQIKVKKNLFNICSLWNDNEHLPTWIRDKIPIGNSLSPGGAGNTILWKWCTGKLRQKKITQQSQPNPPCGMSCWESPAIGGIGGSSTFSSKVPPIIHPWFQVFPEPSLPTTCMTTSEMFTLNVKADVPSLMGNRLRKAICSSPTVHAGQC